VALCSACRPSLASGTAATPQVVTTTIATNVKSGCTPAKASALCWHMAASRGLPHEQISDIAVDPHNPRTVYVSLRQLIVMGADSRATGSAKVMVSRDGGESFSDLTGDLPIADAHRIVLRNGRLYVATDVGIFTAVAGQKKWSRLGTGLPQVAFRSMKLDLSGRYLVAGAYGRGAWVYDFGAPSNDASGAVGLRLSGSFTRGGGVVSGGQWLTTTLLALLLAVIVNVGRRRPRAIPPRIASLPA